MSSGLVHRPVLNVNDTISHLSPESLIRLEFDPRQTWEVFPSHV